jgi:aspartate racemase
VVPCNTAHNFTDEVVAAVGIPVLSIIDETVDEARRRVPEVGSIGLLATTGTGASGVYQRALAARGIACVLPDEADQDIVMSVIYDQVKAGKPGDVDAIRGVAGRLMDRGASLVVLGCTELSVVAEDEGLLADPRFVDSLDVLARRTIDRAGGRVRLSPGTARWAPGPVSPAGWCRCRGAAPGP